MIITGGAIQKAFAGDYLQKHKSDFIIAADSGLEFCRDADIVPDLIMGDFDSARKETAEYFQTEYPDRIRKFRAEKDETDTELALSEAFRRGADQITVLGATGTRLDHVLGNIQLLKQALENGTECVLLDEHNRIRMAAPGTTVISREEQFGFYVSLIPFSEQVEGLTLTGFRYPVTEYTLCLGQPIGVSNEISGERGEISFRKGLLLIIESKD